MEIIVGTIIMRDGKILMTKEAKEKEQEGAELQGRAQEKRRGIQQED